VNTNFVAIIKRIIAEQGEDILANPQRVKGYVNDYAAAENKVERLAFGRCIEYGAYTELKKAPDAEARQRVKAAVAQRVHSNEGLDVALCHDAIDTLEAALFGEKNFCKKCGKELQEGWVSCPFCGTEQITSIQAAYTMNKSLSSVSQPQVHIRRPLQYQQVQHSRNIQWQDPQQIRLQPNAKKRSPVADQLGCGPAFFLIVIMIVIAILSALLAP
jgi:hypothetical protein